MNLKAIGGGVIFLFLVLLILVGGIFCLFYLSYFSEPEFFNYSSKDFFYNDSLIEDSSRDFPNGTLIYPNIRFQDKTISYFIDESCEDYRRLDVEKGFDFLSEKTILDFQQKDFGDIGVYCSDEIIKSDEKHYIVGESKPDYIVDNGYYQIIYNGTIWLYVEDSCDEPLIAIHEILHVLGFKHSSNKKSIMYPTSNCNQEVTQEIIDKIEEIYLDPSLSDLVFQNLTFEKKGFYIDFEAVIINRGLTESSNTNFSIYADNKLIKNYVLENFDVGVGKILSVSNVKIPWNVEKLSFVIDSSNIVDEIDETNNVREFFLKK
jgi:hypothetical protein